MFFKLFRIFPLLLLPIITSCLLYENPKMNKEVVANIIYPDKDCINTCWNGLIPGVSTYNESNEKLLALEFIDNSSIKGNGETKILFGCSNPKLDYCGALEFKNHYLENIFIDLTHASELPLEDAIHFLDEPDYFYLSPGGGELGGCNTEIFWEEKGISIYIEHIKSIEECNQLRNGGEMHKQKKVEGVEYWKEHPVYGEYYKWPGLE